MNTTPNVQRKDRSVAIEPRTTVPAWHYKDVFSAAGLPLQFLVADRLPEVVWPRLARMSAQLRASRQPRWCRAEVAHIASYLGRPPGEPAIREIFIESLASLRLAQWWTLAARHQDGWRPRLQIFGREHLDRALAQGRGAIAWVAPFHFSAIAAKAALFDLGHRVLHLSRPTHGGEVKSRWGARYISPSFIAGEQRFLAERAFVGVDGSPTTALLRLHRHLRANDVVSITVHSRGDRPIEVPFLKGRVRMAPGAPTLARRTGAALLPVFVRLDGGGVVHVIIDPPLDIAGSAGADHAVISGLTERLVPRVLADPGQFRWRGGITPG